MKNKLTWLFWLAVIIGVAWYFMHQHQTQVEEQRAAEIREQQVTVQQRQKDASVAAFALKYNAATNWEKNLPRHGATSAVFSIDVQKALTSASPIFFTAYLHDVVTGTNGMPYAEFTQRYNRDASATDPDFELILIIQLTDEQAQRILNTPKDVSSDEYAVVAKISNTESSAQYADVSDDWPSLYVEGKCVDFSLLK
jgi:hypothetical protein